MIPVDPHRRVSDKHVLFRRCSMPGPSKADDVDHGLAGRLAMTDAAPHVRSKHDTPIQFLRWHLPNANCDEGGRYVLTEEAACILSSLDGPIAVVAVAEISGAGTQFVVRRFLNFERNFPPGHLQRRERGVWMWVRERADDYVLILDFEGLDVLDGGQNLPNPTQPGQVATAPHVDNAALLFSLAVLLSSNLVLLTEDVLSKPDIRKLGFISEIVTDVCDHFGEPHSHRPDLTWVLTNCAMSLFGGDAADEYLLGQLKPTVPSPGTDLDEQTTRVNEVKTWVDRLFPKRALIALPPPGEGIEKGGESAIAVWDELKLEYRMQMIKLNRRVFGSPHYKRVPLPDGESGPLSGPDFIRLAKMCTSALQTKKPSALLGKTVDPWKVFHGEVENADIELALQEYDAHMAKLTLPIPVDELRDQHRRVRQIVVERIRKPVMMRSRAMHLLEQMQQGKLRMYERKNHAAAIVKCKDLCREAFDKTLGEKAPPPPPPPAQPPDFATTVAAFLKDAEAATAPLTRGDEELESRVRGEFADHAAEIEKLKWEFRETKLSAAQSEEKWRATEEKVSTAFAEVTREAERAIAEVSRSAASRIQELAAEVRAKDRRNAELDEETWRLRRAAETWESAARIACAKAEEAEAERDMLVLLHGDHKGPAAAAAAASSPPDPQEVNQTEGPGAPP